MTGAALLRGGPADRRGLPGEWDFSPGNSLVRLGIMREGDGIPP